MIELAIRAHAGPKERAKRQPYERRKKSVSQTDIYITESDTVTYHALASSLLDLSLPESDTVTYHVLASSLLDLSLSLRSRWLQLSNCCMFTSILHTQHDGGTRRRPPKNVKRRQRPLSPEPPPPVPASTATGATIEHH
jgi:hypothetical protein